MHWGWEKGDPVFGVRLVSCPSPVAPGFPVCRLSLSDVFGSCVRPRVSLSLRSAKNWVLSQKPGHQHPCLQPPRSRRRQI